MSIEDRLYALADEYRSLHGMSALADATRVVPDLSATAPDLHIEILALSAAIGEGAAARIAAATDPDTEIGTVTEKIASLNKLSTASVKSAVAVARRLNATPRAQPAPRTRDWANDSVIAGSGPSAPYAPPVATPLVTDALEVSPEFVIRQTGTNSSRVVVWIALIVATFSSIAWLLLD